MEMDLLNLQFKTCTCVRLTIYSSWLSIEVKYLQLISRLWYMKGTYNVFYSTFINVHKINIGAVFISKYCNMALFFPSKDRIICHYVFKGSFGRGLIV